MNGSCPPICPTPRPSIPTGLLPNEAQVIGQWMGEVFSLLIVILLIMSLIVVTGLVMYLTRR